MRPTCNSAASPLPPSSNRNAPRNKEDISVETDGRFSGPGVSDNGAGLAALLAVGRVWKNGAHLQSVRSYHVGDRTSTGVRSSGSRIAAVSGDFL
jgi:hypothetical protein